MTRSWRHTGVKGLGHGNGTCQLKIYKKNYLLVFLSKRERFWPWLEEPKSCVSCVLINDLMKDIIR